MEGLRKQVLSHLLVLVLYLGPLYVMVISGTLPFQSKWNYTRDVKEKFTSWQGLRNYWLVRTPSILGAAVKTDPVAV